MLTSVRNNSPRRIKWSELSDVQFLQNGTGTSLFTADLCGQRVVMKTPLSGMTYSDTVEATKDLKQEAAFLRVLDHPNITRLLGTGSMPMVNGSWFFFLIVEWLEGGTLFDRLYPLAPPSKAREGSKSGKIKSMFSFFGTKKNVARRHSLSGPAEQAEAQLEDIRIAFDLANALRYLHDKADASHVILHRDLKPDNVGFRSDGSVCLFDFGLSTMTPRSHEDQALDKRLHVASRRRDSADGTSSGTHDSSGASNEAAFYLPRYRMTGGTGSIRYMAPEVALNQPYNQSVDVYSFSIILWEMISRTKPYAGMNVQMHRARVCENGERPPLDAKVFREDLASCIRAGWAHDMDARPSFADIVNVLRTMRTMKGSPGISRRPQKGSLIRKSSGTNTRLNSS